MQLQLKRIARKPGYTIGHLYIGGERVCDTLEDTDRGLAQGMPLAEIQAKKVYGKTAIPAGTYDITLKIQSPKFKDRPWAKFCHGCLPRLRDVPGFEGVLIHVGNSPEQTLGCVLVGENKAPGRLLYSTDAFERLYRRLQLADAKGEKITITIE